MTATLDTMTKKNEPAEEPAELVAARELVRQAKEQGLSLTGPDGLLNQLTKTVLEAALDEELTEHLGHERRAPAAAGNVRNGTRSKTVLTEASGHVEIDVPRDRAGTFEPQIVRKRQRRLSGVDEIVLSLYAKGLTTGEISAHFAEIYGASVSKETVSRITDRVLEEMVASVNRPLERGQIPLVVANPDRGDSDAEIRAKQDAGGGQAPLLRVDQAGLVRRGGCRTSRGVVELRISVVHRRWPGELRRDSDQSAVSVPG